MYSCSLYRHAEEDLRHQIHTNKTLNSHLCLCASVFWANKVGVDDDE